MLLMCTPHLEGVRDFKEQLRVSQMLETFLVGRMFLSVVYPQVDFFHASGEDRCVRTLAAFSRPTLLTLGSKEIRMAFRRYP